VDAISSRHNAFVQRCRAVARRRDAASGEVLLDGVHLLGDALAAGVPIDEAAATPAVWESAEGAPLARRLESAGVRLHAAAAQAIEAASPVRSPTGLVALGRWSPVPLARALAPQPALVVCAVGVQDPGNLGALVRAADAAGATAVVVSSGSADPLGWKALRGSMGSAFRVPIVAGADVQAACADARARGIRVVAAVPAGGTALYDCDLTGPVLLLVGGEGAGLPEPLRQQADVSLRIPMRPAVESLNVAVAAGVVLFEARRQRTLVGTP